MSFKEDADRHVPHRISLQHTGAEAIAAYHNYLDGQILSRSLKEFIQNFRNVYGLREYDDELAEEGAGTKDTTSVTEAGVLNVDKLLNRSGQHGVDASFNNTVWGPSTVPSAAKGKRSRRGLNRGPKDWEPIEKEARKARTDDTSRDPAQENFHAACVDLEMHRPVEDCIEEWRAEMASCDEPPTAEQMEFCDLLASRVQAESDELGQGGLQGHSEPVRIFLTGPPGTGKSFATSAACALFKKLRWIQGQQYQTTAFQASTACHSDGQTLHYTCGVPVGDGGTSTTS